MATTFKLQVVFYKSSSGKEPVREWLKKLDKGLWEVRIQLDNRIARVLFTSHQGIMVLLHGFIKKSQKTPPNDLKIAKQRMQALGGHNE